MRLDLSGWLRGTLVAFVIGMTTSPAAAQIIGEDTTFPDNTLRQQTLMTRVTAYGQLLHGVNALGASNLGFEEKKEQDTLFVKGVNANFVLPLGQSVAIASGFNASHVNFFRNKELNFFGLQGNAGLVLAPNGRFTALAGASCSAEFEKLFKSYYNHCGPMVATEVIFGSPRKFHAALSMRGYAAMGDRNRYARYREAGARLTIGTGGRVQVTLEPNAYVRDYSSPTLLAEIFDYKRRDYVGSVPLRVSVRSSRFEFGAFVEPVISWSTDANYRHWDVRGGPNFAVRF